MKTTCVAFSLATIVLFALPSGTHAQGVPGQDKNKCLAGKTSCVTKKISGLLKCRELCQKKPKKCGQAQTDCEAKVQSKFDGGGDPSKGCFAKFLAKENAEKPDTVCTITKDDDAEIEATADAAVSDVLDSLETPICPAEQPVDLGAGCDFEGTTCFWGEECCCSGDSVECFDSYGCNCFNGQLACFFTDPCLGLPPTCGP